MKLTGLILAGIEFGQNILYLGLQDFSLLLYHLQVSMAEQPNDSDWQTYLANVGRWREQYLAQRNRDLAELLTDEHLTATEQFRITLKKMEEEAEILNRCQEQHSRSAMMQSLKNLCINGLIPEEDFQHFSITVQEKLYQWLEEADADL